MLVVYSHINTYRIKQTTICTYLVYTYIIVMCISCFLLHTYLMCIYMYILVYWNVNKFFYAVDVGVEIHAQPFCSETPDVSDNVVIKLLLSIVTLVVPFAL